MEIVYNLQWCSIYCITQIILRFYLFYHMEIEFKTWTYLSTTGYGEQYWEYNHGPQKSLPSENHEEELQNENV